MNQASHAFRFAILTAAVLAVLFRVAYTRADVDLWGHVRFGLDTLEHERLDRADPYSFTSDRPWINHEWLSEVAFAAAWKNAGNAGLIAVKLACFFGAVMLVGVTLRGQGVRSRALALAVAFASLAIVPRVTHIRPQLFSVLLFSALLYLLDRSERRTAVLYWAVPLVALWANLHGGWLVGLGTLVLWSIAVAVHVRRIGVLVVPLAAAAATLINPYGTGLWSFLAETVRLGREGITEWGPIWTNASRLAVWITMSAVVVLILLKARPANLGRLLVPAVWGLAAFRVNRLDAFFALSVVALLLPQLRRFIPIMDEGGPNQSWIAAVPRRTRVLLVGAVLAAAALLPPARRAVSCVEVTPSWWPEPEAAAFLRSQRLAGRMVTYFNWGEYAIWFAPASLKVSFDGRRETIYSEATIQGHLELYNATPAGFAYLQGLQADYVWLPVDLTVTQMLVDRGWRPIFSGPASVVLAEHANAARHPTSTVVSSAVGLARCFPGP